VEGNRLTAWNRSASARVLPSQFQTDFLADSPGWDWETHAKAYYARQRMKAGSRNQSQCADRHSQGTGTPCIQFKNKK